MIRTVIEIDEEKCNGCGICADACHEGAIGIIDGKAHLLRDDYCDGLGDCLPACPTGAITFVEREAAAYDEAAVITHKLTKEIRMNNAANTHSCPGSAQRTIERPKTPEAPAGAVPSRLANWPVQIKLAPITAPYFDGANLLVAADCCAYAYGNFHAEFMANRVTLIGCPKLDNIDYSEKLTEIIRQNDIKSLTILRMEVPCCGGLEHAATEALRASGKFIPWRVVTVTIDGGLRE